MVYSLSGTFKVFLSLALVALIADLACAQVDIEDAAAIWLFDEGSGDVAADASPNGNNAVFQNDPVWGSGKFGKAISFDGVDDHLVAEDSDSLDVVGEELTLLAWVNAEGWVSGWNHIIRKTTPASPTPYFYILGVHSTGLAFVHLQTDAGDFYDIQGASVLPTGEWIHLAMVYDGAEIVIYVDGEVDNTSPANGAIQPNDGVVRIGLGNPAGYFAGIIDEAAIFHRALSQDEIKDVMTKGLSAMFLAVEPEFNLSVTWGDIKEVGE